MSYDDPRSYAFKGGYIHSIGLKGFAIWEAGGDFKDVLLDSIRESLSNIMSCRLASGVAMKKGADASHVQ